MVTFQAFLHVPERSLTTVSDVHSVAQGLGGLHEQAAAAG